MWSPIKLLTEGDSDLGTLQMPTQGRICRPPGDSATLLERKSISLHVRACGCIMGEFVYLQSCESTRVEMLPLRGTGTGQQGSVTAMLLWLLSLRWASLEAGV